MDNVIVIIIVAWSSAALVQHTAAQVEMLFREGREIMAARTATGAGKAFEESRKPDLRNVGKPSRPSLPIVVTAIDRALEQGGTACGRC